MTSGLPTADFGLVVRNFDARRIPLSSREREQRRGKYPYYGAAGIIDYVDQPIFSGLYLLVGEDGSVVKEDGSPFLQLASGEFWVNNHAHVLQGEDDIETRYLYYALSATNIRPFVTGAVQPKLSQGNMNRVPIPYPDRDGREAIVAALGSLDDKIEQNRRTSEALERLAQATFKAWFVDFEPVRAKATGAKSFPGMPPETFAALPTTFTSSPLGPIPEGWEVRSIGDLVTVKGGATPSTKEPDFWENGTHCWVTPKDLSGLRDPVLLGTERRITNIGAAQISSGVLPLDTVLLSSRAPIGYTALAKVPTAINQGFIALVCDGLLPPLYVFHWVRFAMEDIKGRASGTTFPEISKAAFRPIPTVVPSAKLLAAFEGRCEPLFDLVTAIVQESVKLAELRDYLLPRLLSGSVRVGDDSNG